MLIVRELLRPQASTSSKLVDGCKLALSQLTTKHEIKLYWVPGHSNVEVSEVDTISFFSISMFLLLNKSKKVGADLIST